MPNFDYIFSHFTNICRCNPTGRSNWIAVCSHRLPVCRAPPQLENNPASVGPIRQTLQHPFHPVPVRLSADDRPIRPLLRLRFRLHPSVRAHADGHVRQQRSSSEDRHHYELLVGERAHHNRTHSHLLPSSRLRVRRLYVLQLHPVYVDVLRNFRNARPPHM